MPINPLAPGGPQRYRIRELKTTVDSPTGPLTLWRREVTTIMPDGSMETTSEIHTEIRDGVKFASIEDLKGQCENCFAYLGVDTIRFCAICGKTLCRKCIRHVDDEIGDLCFLCLRKLKRKLRLQLIWRIMTAPFVDRSEE